MTQRACRFCSNSLQTSFCNLGMTPLSNSYLDGDACYQKEPFYPLHAYVCGHCYLVQLEAAEAPQEIFQDYAYFSSYSTSWLKHAEKYVERVIEHFAIKKGDQIVEIASNDGYLLQFFQKKGFSVLGVEPAENVGKVAQSRGIPTHIEFFGAECARALVQNKKADLLIGNNVLAHVPNLNDFVEGLKILLSEKGLLTLEFPHLLKLIEGKQFDTIYHEHFSYFSFFTVEKVLKKHGLVPFDVEELSTHGGSLRVYVKHQDAHPPIAKRVKILEDKEKQAHLQQLDFYKTFNQSVQKVKRDLLAFLIGEKEKGKRIVAYGAAAKGNTLLNFCGLGLDFIDYVVDKSPHKQGKFLPGTHIPIRSPDLLKETKPDYVMILPWNLKDEIVNQTAYVRQWGGRFIVPIPQVRIL